tara:strand:- start:1905 stop:2264 length:360 start_codon:yes stop_codon:yes gene_type:complete
MNENVVNEFVTFYYNCLNTKSEHLLSPYLKNNTKIIRNNCEFTGVENILNGISVLNGISSLCYYTPLKYNVMMNGDRRANIIVSGKINGTMLYFSEFILLSLSNRKEYWIHSSIFQVTD